MDFSGPKSFEGAPIEPQPAPGVFEGLASDQNVKVEMGKLSPRTREHLRRRGLIKGRVALTAFGMISPWAKRDRGRSSASATIGINHGQKPSTQQTNLDV
jgi:hypothetical protein